MRCSGVACAKQRDCACGDRARSSSRLAPVAAGAARLPRSHAATLRIAEAQPEMARRPSARLGAEVAAARYCRGRQADGRGRRARARAPERRSGRELAAGEAGADPQSADRRCASADAQARHRGRARRDDSGDAGCGRDLEAHALRAGSAAAFAGRAGAAGRAEAIAVGAYGSYYSSTDGGSTWTGSRLDAEIARRPRSTAATMLQIERYRGGSAATPISIASSRPRRTRFYIAGEAGHLYRSDDAGATWIELASPYEGSFFGVLPLDGAVAAGVRTARPPVPLRRCRRSLDSRSRPARWRCSTMRCASVHASVVDRRAFRHVLLERTMGAELQRCASRADRKGLSAVIAGSEAPAK